MGVVTLSSSAARTPLGLTTKLLTQSQSRRPTILSFKTSDSNHEPASLSMETSKEKGRRKRRIIRLPEKVMVVSIEEAAPSGFEVDYNEAAAKLEHIFRHSPTTSDCEVEVQDQDQDQDQDHGVIIRRLGKKGTTGNGLVRSTRKKSKRLSLEKRVALRKEKERVIVAGVSKSKRFSEDYEDDKMFKLVKEYSSAYFVGLDWKKMKMPPVLPSSEQEWLFKLMQPMNAILQVRDTLQNDIGRLPTDPELAEAVNMELIKLRKNLEVGRAARNKMIKHNLRLVLFVMSKYFHDFVNGPKFQDLCQAGVSGLITAIDRFEPGRKFRLSTYSLFWIRHAIIRSMTLSSFTKVSFGLESVRVDIKRAKLELMFELERMPSDEEIIERVGISARRYNEVMRASKPIISLNAKNSITQEEYIKGISDVDAAEGDEIRQPALLRLALDDVLDSLKPKESLVIRQRYGLDGKGDRTLGEIAHNLKISREMVRKYEVKALMKLKHPARVDYLRHYIH